LLAKRPVHPNILQLQDQRLREQARSHRFRIRHTALPFFAGKPRSNRHLIRPRLHDPRQGHFFTQRGQGGTPRGVARWARNTTNTSPPLKGTIATTLNH